MKTIITHIRPHIDDVCAVWLLKRYDPEHGDAELDFIPTNAAGGSVTDDPNITYVGVGRGRFDEHKGDTQECASSLVYAHVRDIANIPEREQEALDKLIAWVLKEDMGKFITLPLREFSVPVILRGYYKAAKRNSREETELGMAMLDGMFASLMDLVQLERDWEGRREFASRFGKTVAIETNAHGADSHAYRHGFDLVVHTNLQHDYHDIRARADSHVDLTDVYKRLKEREPRAGWYLHHSKRMVICGGNFAPGSTPSKMSMNDLIDLLI